MIEHEDANKIKAWLEGWNMANIKHLKKNTCREWRMKYEGELCKELQYTPMRNIWAIHVTLVKALHGHNGCGLSSREHTQWELEQLARVLKHNYARVQMEYYMKGSAMVQMQNNVVQSMEVSASDRFLSIGNVTIWRKCRWTPGVLYRLKP